MRNTHPGSNNPLLHRSVWGAALLLFAGALVVAWNLLPPPLPKVVRLGAGPLGGHYARFGEALRGEVAEHGIELVPVATGGSIENIRLLLNGEVDVALVQSGNLSEAEAEQLASIATVFYEPMLVVKRAAGEPSRIPRGKIAIGVAGSGGHALARELLADLGLGEGVPPGTRLIAIGEERALQALQAGEVDTAVFVTSISVPWVRTLFADPGLQVTDFALAEAFTRHYRYLKQVVIPAGLIDLASQVPQHDVHVIATTASLVIRPGAHHALIPLLIESTREQLKQGSLLAAPGAFPSPYGVEAPLADEAQQYFERGPSFLYRWIPFRYAFAATRLTIVLLPLLTLLYPFFHTAGPLYRWIIQRRVYRWYGVLARLEEEMDAGDARALQRIYGELDQVGDEIRATRVPTAYGARLFTLRAHRRLLVDRLATLEKNARGS